MRNRFENLRKFTILNGKSVPPRVREANVTPMRNFVIHVFSERKYNIQK